MNEYFRLVLVRRIFIFCLEYLVKTFYNFWVFIVEKEDKDDNDKDDYDDDDEFYVLGV